jgi:hypothetical protein
MSASRRTPALKKRSSTAAQSDKPAVRPLKDIQRDLARLHPKTRRAQAHFMELIDRVNELSKERDSHPDTLAANLTNLRLGAEATLPALSESEPELGAVLTDIAADLELARAVVQTAWQAIEHLNLGGTSGLEDVLLRHADNPICDCVDRLRAAIENARLRGSRIVVTKPAEDSGAGS